MAVLGWANSFEFAHFCGLWNDRATFRVIHTTRPFRTCMHRHAAPNVSSADEPAGSRESSRRQGRKTDERRKPEIGRRQRQGLVTGEVGSWSTEKPKDKHSTRVGGWSPANAEDAISDWTCELINDENARDRKVSGVFVFAGRMCKVSHNLPFSFMRASEWSERLPREIGS